MADQRDTGISWTDETWNPVVGCSIVSPACTNCYAMAMASRIEKMAPGQGRQTHYAGTTKIVKDKPVWTGKLAMAPDSIVLRPLHWKRPRRVFVNSMSDLFHEDMPDEWIDRIFAVMALAPQHTFQVLTKRPERMRDYLTRPVSGPWAGRAFVVGDDGVQRDMTDVRMRMIEAVPILFRSVPARQLNLAAEMSEPHGDGFMPRWPLPNVWLGVTAEDQARADERIPHLLATPAAVRFVSAEPLLGPINYAALNLVSDTPQNALSGVWAQPTADGGYVNVRGPRLDWIIVGGESGPGARPTHPDWVRSIRDQCAAAGVAFHFKQWGCWAPNESGHPITGLPTSARNHGQFVSHTFPDGALMNRTTVAMAGRTLDGVIHDAFPVTR